MSAPWRKTNPGVYVREANGYRVVITKVSETRRNKWNWVSLRRCSDGKWDLLHDGPATTLEAAKAASSYWIRKHHAENS